MLTWTKEKQHQPISLSFKQREPFFSNELLLAFVIAIGVHLLFLILFKIDLGMLSSAAPLPPATLTVQPQGFKTTIEQNKGYSPTLAFLHTTRQNPTLLPSPDIKETRAFSPRSLHRESYKATPLFSKGILLQKESTPLLLSHYEPMRALLEFEAEPKTGKIYYIGWIEHTGNPEWDKKIETYIKGLTLQIPSSTTPYGTLDIQFISTGEGA